MLPQIREVFGGIGPSRYAHAPLETLPCTFLPLCNPNLLPLYALPSLQISAQHSTSLACGLAYRLASPGPLHVSIYGNSGRFRGCLRELPSPKQAESPAGKTLAEDVSAMLWSNQH